VCKYSSSLGNDDRSLGGDGGGKEQGCNTYDGLPWPDEKTTPGPGPPRIRRFRRHLSVSTCKFAQNSQTFHHNIGLLSELAAQAIVLECSSGLNGSDGARGTRCRSHLSPCRSLFGFRTKASNAAVTIPSDATFSNLHARCSLKYRHLRSKPWRRLPNDNKYRAITQYSTSRPVTLANLPGTVS